MGGTNSGDGSDDVGGHGYCLEGYRGPLCAVCETGHYRDTDSQTCETCPPGGLELPDSTFTSPPFLVLYAVVAVIIAKLIMDAVNRYCTKRFDLNDGETLR